MKISLQSCRICSDVAVELESFNSAPDGTTLADMLRCCVKLEIQENDGLPYQCCVECKNDLVIAYKLVVRCLESDAKFRDKLKRNATTEDVNVEENVKIETDSEDQCAFEEPLFDSNLEITESCVIKNETRSSSSDEDNFPADKSDEDDVSEGKNDETDTDKDVPERTRRPYTRRKSTTTPKRCCKCRTRLETLQQVQQHSKEHAGCKITDPRKIKARPFECPVCFKRYTKRRSLQLHQREMYVDKPFPCQECEEDFLTESSLNEHRESHENEKAEKKSAQLKCCACYEQFESEELLKKHAEDIHLPESYAASNDGENQFSCDVCYRRYKTKRILMDHKSKPYRNKQYQCSQCGRIFRDKCALSDHERCHQGERPFACPICSKTFAIRDSYRKHVKSHSIEDDRFKCEMCGKGFKSKGNLKDHYITHATDYRPIVCSLCSATFTRKSCLKSHMRMHTGEKPFKCNLCDASYAFSTDLKRHIMAHKGIKPYVCNVCGRGYPRQDYLRKHLASHNNAN